MKTVLIFGSFDGIHDGHRSLIKQAQEYGAATISLAPDIQIQTLKGHAPKHSFAERKQALLENFPDTTIIPSDTDQSWSTVITTQPDCIVLGYDQTQLRNALESFLEQSKLNIPIHIATSHEPNKYKSSILNNQTK
jgi:cytidyltransferase-like protein